DLLDLLLREATRLVARETIAHDVWADTCESDANVIEVYIRRLRRKLKDAGYAGRIRTMWGVGYVLEPHDASEPAHPPGSPTSAAPGPRSRRTPSRRARIEPRRYCPPQPAPRLTPGGRPPRESLPNEQASTRLLPGYASRHIPLTSQQKGYRQVKPFTCSAFYNSRLRID